MAEGGGCIRTVVAGELYRTKQKAFFIAQPVVSMKSYLRDLRSFMKEKLGGQLST